MQPLPNTLEIPKGTNMRYKFLTASITNLEEYSNLSPEKLQKESIKILQGHVNSGEDLYQTHIDAWLKLWSSRVEVTGDLSLAQSINSSIYCKLSHLSIDIKTFFQALEKIGTMDSLLEDWQAMVLTSSSPHHRIQWSHVLGYGNLDV